MILTDKERNDPNRDSFIPENTTFVFEDGKTFDLEDPY